MSAAIWAKAFFEISPPLLRILECWVRRWFISEITSLVIRPARPRAAHCFESLSPGIRTFSVATPSALISFEIPFTRLCVLVKETLLELASFFSSASVSAMLARTFLRSLAPSTSTFTPIFSLLSDIASAG
ncbi:hypothetical protein [Methylobacterium indicum]|uniref:hypothetical protein n=1 Tax=Methylobacterium indicum TaxID=1775910 RepID=UPI001A91117C|nr:hypothetical protein [Methylobacterium indicum]